MKKVILLVLAAILMVSFAACSASYEVLSSKIDSNNWEIYDHDNYGNPLKDFDKVGVVVIRNAPKDKEKAVELCNEIMQGEDFDRIYAYNDASLYDDNLTDWMIQFGEET